MATVLGIAAVSVALVVLGSLLFYYARTGAPPVPAKASEVHDVITLLRESGEPSIIYELGCGWGTLALGLARAFPDSRVVALELSPLPFLVARLRASRHPNLLVLREDFHDVDVSDAEAVTAYLMIRPMIELAEKLDRELRAGTAVVALTFSFRGRRATRELRGSGVRGTASLYRWPARAKASR